MKTINFIALCAALMPAIAAQAQEASPPAWLPTTVGLHIASQHEDSGKVPGDPLSRGWNNANTGAFIGWHLGGSELLGQSLSHQIIVGGLRNSLYQTSHYLSLDTTAPIAQTRMGDFGAALSLSIISGYDKLQSEYAGGAVPAGQRIATRCTPATGCRSVLVKDAIRLAIAPGLDYKPAFSHAPTLRLSYLHDSGGTGSKAVHLTSRWSRNIL